MVPYFVLLYFSLSNQFFKSSLFNKKYYEFKLIFRHHIILFSIYFVFLEGFWQVGVIKAFLFKANGRLYLFNFLYNLLKNLKICKFFWKVVDFMLMIIMCNILSSSFIIVFEFMSNAILF